MVSDSQPPVIVPSSALEGIEEAKATATITETYLPIPQCKTKPTPSSIITVYDHTSSENQQQWFIDCGHLFGRFLQVGKYDLHQQYQHLLFLQRHLVPALGPHPQKWRSTITRSGLPIEYSLNFQNDLAPTLRIGFEPVSILSGGSRDPYNQVPVGDLINKLAKLDLPGFDPQLYNHFVNEFYLPPAEEEVLQQLGISADKSVCSQFAFGFDLKGGSISVKGYVFCGRKALATGLPVGQLIADSVRKIETHTQSQDAFSLLDDYMVSSSGYNEYTFLAWDCVSIQRSRLKFYGVHNEVTFRKVAEMWTLDGRLNHIPDIITGLDLLQRLWQLLNFSDQGDCQYTGGFDDGITSGEKEVSTPLIWNYELSLGSKFPQPKFYFPIHARGNDLKVAQAIATFWHSIGWVDLASGYPETLKDLYPYQDITQTSRLQSWISFAYSQKNGVYMSIYYHSSDKYTWED